MPAIAHFHYVIVGGTVFGIFAGLIYWWPKMFGKVLNEKMNHWFFWLFFIGFHLTFFLQHFLGLMGMPRRYWVFLEGQGLDLFNFNRESSSKIMTLLLFVLFLPCYTCHMIANLLLALFASFVGKL